MVRKTEDGNFIVQLRKCENAFNLKSQFHTFIMIKNNNVIKLYKNRNNKYYIMKN